MTAIFDQFPANFRFSGALPPHMAGTLSIGFDSSGWDTLFMGTPPHLAGTLSLGCDSSGWDTLFMGTPPHRAPERWER